MCKLMIQAPPSRLSGRTTDIYAWAPVVHSSQKHTCELQHRYTLTNKYTYEDLNIDCSSHLASVKLLHIRATTRRTTNYQLSRKSNPVTMETSFWKYNDKTGQATIRMNRQAVLKRWWTSLQGESFTVFSTASLFSSIEASSVLFSSPFCEQKIAKYVLNLYVTLTANTKKILDFRIGPKIGLIRCSKGDKILHTLQILSAWRSKQLTPRCCRCLAAGFWLRRLHGSQHAVDARLSAFSSSSVLLPATSAVCAAIAYV